jgi:hypothetical protein
MMEFMEVIEGYKSDRYWIGSRVDDILSRLYELDEDSIQEEKIESIRGLMEEYLDQFVTPSSIEAAIIQYNSDRTKVVNMFTKIQEIIQALEAKAGYINMEATLLQIDSDATFSSVEEAEEVYESDFNNLRNFYERLLTRIERLEERMVSNDYDTDEDDPVNTSSINENVMTSGVPNSVSETLWQKIVRKVKCLFK